MKYQIYKAFHQNWLWLNWLHYKTQNKKIAGEWGKITDGMLTANSERGYLPIKSMLQENVRNGGANHLYGIQHLRFAL